MDKTDDGTALPPSVPPQAIVFFGDRLIEVADVTGPSLEDLCEAFGITFTPGTSLQERATGRVVATLPFETLPPIVHSTDKKPLEQFSPQGESEEAEGHGADGQGDDEGSLEPVLFDLIITASGTDAVDNVDEGEDPLQGVPEGLGEAAQRLVTLGAVGLLAEETDAQVEAHPYVSEDAPGLLKRILYADEVYCPYRASRDPLHTSRSVASKVTSAHAREQLYGNEKPYWATLDTYGVPLLPTQPESAVASPLFFGQPLSPEMSVRVFAGL